VLFLLLALVVVTTLGEEIMFRGYIQTGLERRYGVAIGWLVAALLFSLRHMPADLYWGWGAPAIQWISRLSQLGGGALIFGWIRHRSRSTISTWIMHLLGWIYVIFG
jgi:membrane protease YdiL (CAAX protease family)